LDGQCEISVNNRHTCKSCRLAKCFKCGMSTDFFRESKRTQSNTKTLVKVKMQHHPEQVRLDSFNIIQII